jgi:hypothetical protein
MLRQIVVAILLATWFFPPAARADSRVSQQQRPSQENAASAPGGVPGTPAETRRLTEREQRAQSLQDFEGGGRVTIGTTTLIIILLLVIILVLIL